MPQTDTAARAAMRLGEEIHMVLLTCSRVSLGGAHEEIIRMIAAALSSHGLREAVEKIQEALDHCYQDYEGQEITWVCPSSPVTEALTALLGEGETLKAEEQTDG